MTQLQEIDRINKISQRDFISEYVSKGKPLIINNLAKNWTAVQNWNIEYLIQKSSDIEVCAIGYRNQKMDLNAKTGARTFQYPFADCLEKLYDKNLNNTFSIATSLDDFPEELKRECPVPEYCADKKFLRSRLFISANMSCTPLHQDLFENLYTIVSGSKRIILYAPESPVYRNSIFSKLPNFAQVDPEKPDYEKFPKFSCAKQFSINLKKGETLYIPSFWWHHLRNTELTIATSYWWGSGWKNYIAYAATIYKALRKI